MAVNPNLSVQAAGYIDPTLKRRMAKVSRKSPRLTISKQVAECIEQHLPEIEARVGLKSTPTA